MADERSPNVTRSGRHLGDDDIEAPADEVARFRDVEGLRACRRCRPGG
jgi:hypothetical protein